MPPRKRARVSRATSPDPASLPKSPTPAADDTSPSKDEQLLANPWTDEEEIGLFKGLMRFKPTGFHKHFHLLALHAWLLEHHHIHPRSPHTRPAGIWAKLHTLYDLAALDAREDSRQLAPLPEPRFPSASGHGNSGGGGDGSDGAESPADGTQDEDDSDADAYSEAANRVGAGDFVLPPDEGFEEMMWRQRFAPSPPPTAPSAGASSPPLLPELNLADEPPVGFTPSFKIELASPPKSRKRGVAGRRGRSRRAPAPSRRSARQAELATEEDDDEDEAGDDEEGDENDRNEDEEDSEDEDEDEDDEEDDDDDDEDEDEDEHTSGTPAPRSRRAPAESKRTTVAQTRSSRRTRR